MEHASTVVSGIDRAAEPIEGGRFWARIMGKSTGSDTRKSKDSSDDIPAGPMPASTIDSVHHRPPVGTTYTLRVKPDRRRSQLPMAEQKDRRRRS